MLNVVDHTGKSVLVTGGASGIGFATAMAFSQAGAKVFIAGRNLKRCQNAVDQIAKKVKNENAEAICVDICNEYQVEKMYKSILDRTVALDIAFFNAGIGMGGLIVDQSLSEFEKVMATNSTGTWLCLKYALKHMIPIKKGTIVTNLSVHSFRNIFEGTAAYTASKHAALALTKAAALEAAKYGIRVNAIAPGPVMTEMLEESTRDFGGVKFWCEKIPQARVGNPQEVAQAVLWLASDKTPFANGAVLSIDGAFLST